jgi:hypothetical protein
MKRSLLFRSLALASLLFLSVPQVRADGFDIFSYSNGSDTYSWVLPSSLTGLVVDTTGGCGVGTVSNCFVSGVLFGVTTYVSMDSGPAVVQSLVFYHGGIQGGGVTDYTNLSVNLFSPQLYSGPESNPTFIPGVYTAAAPTIGTLTISPVTSITPVPEASAFLLLLSGLLAVLGAVSLKKLSPRVQPSAYRSICPARS